MKKKNEFYRHLFALYAPPFSWDVYVIASDSTAMLYCTMWWPMELQDPPCDVEKYTKFIRPQSDEHFTQTIRRKELKKAIAAVPLKDSIKKVPCNKCIDGRREEDCGNTKVEVDCKYCGATEAGPLAPDPAALIRIGNHYFTTYELIRLKKTAKLLNETVILYSDTEVPLFKIGNARVIISPARHGDLLNGIKLKGLLRGG